MNQHHPTSLLADTTPRTPNDTLRPESVAMSTRRRWLGSASGIAVSLAMPAVALAQGSRATDGSSADAPSADTSSAGRSSASRSTGSVSTGIRPALPAGRLTDLSCQVSASRLDTLVAAIFNDFNAPTILPAFDSARHGARFDVQLHRLVAPLVVPETGESLMLSGLLALPVGAKGPLPVVCWQHGTILSFEQVPSNMLKLADPAYAMTDAKDSLETLLNVHRFAGQGYAVIAADYVGKGPFRNGRGEAYAVKDVTVHTCLRMLEAGESTMQSMGVQRGPLYLNGWSQGALNTQWLHQELRRRKIPVAATSVASPFNALSETMRFWAGAQRFDPPDGLGTYPPIPVWISLCMIILLGSYELQYGLKGLLRSAVAPQFRDMAEAYWKTYDLRFDPGKQFPSGSTLLVPNFFDGFTHDLNSAFLRQVAANTASYWRYDSPIRFHIGLADEAIHPTLARRALAAGGSQTSEVTVPRASHRGTFLASLYGDATSLGGKSNAVDWFDSLR